jgi:hypothetical protein
MADRHIASGYIFSQAEIPIAALGYNYISLFNPVGSTKVASVAGIFVSHSLFTSSSVASPLRGWRISTASGGTLQALSAIAKVQTTNPDPTCEVRTGDPTCTLGAAIFNSPPPIQDKANWLHEVALPSGILPFTIRPGEGIVLRTELGIGQSADWNLTIVWTEQGRR